MFTAMSDELPAMSPLLATIDVLLSIVANEFIWISLIFTAMLDAFVTILAEFVATADTFPPAANVAMSLAF
jgi:hypothetical protein